MISALVRRRSGSAEPAAPAIADLRAPQPHHGSASPQAACMTLSQEADAGPSAPDRLTGAWQADPSYEACLVLFRAREYDAAQRAFERLLACQPNHHKAWISYAQVGLCRLWRRCRGLV
jgi:hypothetical protein